MDDLLRERDYQLRELQETWAASLRSTSSPHNTSSEPTNILAGRLPDTLPIHKPHEPPEPSVLNDRAVPRWSREPSPTNSVIVIDSDDCSQQITTSHQSRTGTQTSIRLTPNSNLDQAQGTPLSNSSTDQQSVINPTDARGFTYRTQDEKLHDASFLAFQRDRNIPWSRIRENYEQRFGVARTRGTLTVRHYCLPKDERVSSGCVALTLRSRPRLKELVERLWPG